MTSSVMIGSGIGAGGIGAAPTAGEANPVLWAAAPASDNLGTGSPEATDGELLTWLRQHITGLCPPALLGVVCAGIGVELWRISPAHLPDP